MESGDEKSRTWTWIFIPSGPFYGFPWSEGVVNMRGDRVLVDNNIPRRFVRFVGIW